MKTGKAVSGFHLGTGIRPHLLAASESVPMPEGLDGWQRRVLWNRVANTTKNHSGSLLWVPFRVVAERGTKQ